MSAPDPDGCAAGLGHERVRRRARAARHDRLRGPPELTPVISAGEGFRSLDAGSLTLCNAPTIKLTGVPSSLQLPCVPGSPYSQVMSFEGGVRSDIAEGRFVTSLTAFQTNVANELVFEVASGGLTTETASTRRGIVGSFLARPTDWLLVSTALSVQTATFNTLVVGTSHYVPNVPAVLWRTDANVHGELLRFKGAPVTGRAGVGYTLLGGRHVNDTIIAPTNNVLNALASVRYRFVELGFDMFNVLGLQVRRRRGVLRVELELQDRAAAGVCGDPHRRRAAAHGPGHADAVLLSGRPHPALVG